MMHKHKRDYTNRHKLIFFCLLSVLIGLSIFAYFHSSKNSKDPKQPAIPVSVSTPTPVVTMLHLQPLVTNDVYNGWYLIRNDEFDISFKIPPSFYWKEGGRSTTDEGAFFTPYIIGKNAFIQKNQEILPSTDGTTYLKNPNNYPTILPFSFISVVYPYRGTNLFVFHTDLPDGRVPESDDGCGIYCTYRNDSDVTILGKSYHVRVYYETKNKLTWDVVIDGIVPAGPKSKWRTFGLQPFIGFIDTDFNPVGVGLSQTARLVLASIAYNP